MFNNNLPVSSLFCKISLLCLPHCHPTPPACTFCSSIFCTMCTIPIQCTVCLLYVSVVVLHLLLYTCITHNSNHLQSLLCSTFLYSLCILCMLSIPWFCIPACRVLCLFIMETLQLLCLFMPSIHHHWVS
jgi:hypothetical protein